MKRQTLCTVAAATLFTLALAASPAEVSAQSAGSWVDIARGRVGAGANADGMIQIAKSRSSSKNGVDFGHGFALGAGPNGLAISNSIGVGGGQAGAAHNVQLNIGRGGAHVSHGGVVTQGGNRRVVSGGQTGTSGGRVYGGSHSTGYGQHTKAYSKSQTRQWGGQVYQGQVNQYRAYQGQPNATRSRSMPARVIRGGGIRMFGR
ncbi:hypothetical protein Enr13x_72880 [Stieleria neptunia]|uniref:Uncharacterized protein n=1 Tax=Stieleria neptunia TaxID=2527979 RepID=A0A518I2P4_9BACT|nr:hypothetical protein [Stieleria neptunia]QDV47379.1 hypothetical protein Enr13x_72880 [Stieleria neptunia]